MDARAALSPPTLYAVITAAAADTKAPAAAISASFRGRASSGESAALGYPWAGDLPLIVCVSSSSVPGVGDSAWPKIRGRPCLSGRASSGAIPGFRPRRELRLSRVASEPRGGSDGPHYV